MLLTTDRLVAYYRICK